MRNRVLRIVSMLTSLLCGCLNVITFSVCILKVTTRLRVLGKNVYGQVFSVSVQLLESVKGTTKQTCISCKGFR